ncbi:TadE/TadG family type IV pilus assembly protein [Tropicimonas sp. IMCC6043]|uniref:TadE/TadG family type IV pilus assembly protein n=1 Tax=Tropicimonas sp. IMCC6043 TaxID=2510645 RepID=UPI0013EC7D52|nr:TadE/TadG family type IV pilus assembly protein [Tropicimonas sp. IMCC6043]
MTMISRHIRQTARRFLRADSGAVLVEFAILLPLTLAVFALIAEGGRLFWSYQNAITGVRDTTRHLGRIAPSDLCGAGSSKSISDYTTFVSDSLTALSTPKIEVGLDTLDTVCVGEPGEYRGGNRVAVAVVSAKLTITELPFAPFFQLVGGSDMAQIETTVTDRSRVFGP